MGSDAGRRTVLVIDDDQDVRGFIASRLAASVFDVVVAESGEQGLQLMSPEVDLVLVDVGLPGIDGYAVVREIRKQHDTPIMMLTANGDESDRVLGLEIGADDYVVKPFLPRELIARISALIRRADRNDHADDDAGVIPFGDLLIHTDAVEVHRNGEVVALTNREFDLLVHFARAPRQVFSRDQLLRAVWATEPGWQGSATVTEHVHRLRRHVESDPSAPRHIVTVRGAGYRFDP